MKEFEWIYREYLDGIYQYFYCLYGNQNLSAELTQETFYQAFASLHRFREECSLKTWLFSIAKHVHYQHLSQMQKETPADRAEEKMDDNTPQVETHLVLREAIAHVKEPYRQVLILRLMSDLSFQQIAFLMEKTENWAKVTFHRGKRMLREYIAKEDLQ